MRFFFKLVVAPFWLLLALLYAFCQFLVVIGGTVLGIVSFLLALVSLLMLVLGQAWLCLALLVVAFLASPFGLTRLAAGLVGALGGMKRSLRSFLAS